MTLRKRKRVIVAFRSVFVSQKSVLPVNVYSYLRLYVYESNPVPRVLWLFSQRVIASRDFLIGCPVTAAIVLPQKTCG